MEDKSLVAPANPGDEELGGNDNRLTISSNESFFALDADPFPGFRRPQKWFLAHPRLFTGFTLLTVITMLSVNASTNSLPPAVEEIVGVAALFVVAAFGFALAHLELWKKTWVSQKNLLYVSLSLIRTVASFWLFDSDVYPTILAGMFFGAFFPSCLDSSVVLRQVGETRLSVRYVAGCAFFLGGVADALTLGQMNSKASVVLFTFNEFEFQASEIVAFTTEFSVLLYMAFALNAFLDYRAFNLMTPKFRLEEYSL